MASTEGPVRASDRHGRRRPFSAWMKKIASLKSSHTDSRLANSSFYAKNKRDATQRASPYDAVDKGYNTSEAEQFSPQFSHPSHASSVAQSKHSMSISHDSQAQPKSRAPTLGTTAETTVSRAGTSATIPRTEGDRDSTFSSPSPSVRSMTTTLTTMQSTTPATGANHTPTNSTHPAQIASAVPAHLAPHSHPTTYHNATANNLLTDDASILTLASSSKRRRRNSLDTNASIRALAPASMFGGSRESLPLSVLSGTIIHPGQGSSYNVGDNASLRDNASVNYPRSASALNAERASLISSSGVTAPALTSERNSYISNKPTGDGASVRSGLLGQGDRERERSLYHARNDSLGGISITRDRNKEPKEGGDKDYFKEREMVTAPTSPMPA